MDLFNLYVTNMAVDIRRMGKAELDELNRSVREWRERNKPAQAVQEAIPESSQADIADPRETKTPPSTVGEQIELFMRLSADDAPRSWEQRNVMGRQR